MSQIARHQEKDFAENEQAWPRQGIQKSAGEQARQQPAFRGLSKEIRHRRITLGPDAARRNGKTMRARITATATTTPFRSRLGARI